MAMRKSDTLKREQTKPGKVKMQIRFRLKPGAQLWPAAKAINGQIFTFIEGERITHGPYRGEKMMIPSDAQYPCDGPAYIPSRDLVEVRDKRKTQWKVSAYCYKCATEIVFKGKSKRIDLANLRYCPHCGKANDPESFTIEVLYPTL